MTGHVLRGLVALSVVLASGCASEEPTAVTSPTRTQASSTSVAVTASTDASVTDDEFPNIVAAEATIEDGGSWRFDVTVSSPYDTPERYADAWRVLGPDGTEYGIRVLTHDHATEQPFTRSQGGIEVPEEVAIVTIQGRDLVNGWGGGTLELELP